MRALLPIALALSSLALSSLVAAPVSARSAEAPPARLDHVLLWGRNIDQTTAVMAVKLGFQVRPGHDDTGVANRYVRFADSGYLELLGVTRPKPVFDPGMQEDRKALKGAPGARTFGIRTGALDATHRALAALHFATTPIFSGPDSRATPPGWRLFAFEPGHAPLSSNTFFIDYAADYAPDQYQPGRADDYRITREHPNGARELSAIWLLSAQADADRRQLARMGYDHATPVRLPELGASGFCVAVGPTALLALQPDGPGIARRTLADGGPRILGVSIGVDDLGRALRWVQRGYQRKLPTYQGLAGKAFLAPTGEDLGMLIEFHALQPAASPCATSTLSQTAARSTGSAS